MMNWESSEDLADASASSSEYVLPDIDSDSSRYEDAKDSIGKFAVSSLSTSTFACTSQTPVNTTQTPQSSQSRDQPSVVRSRKRKRNVDSWKKTINKKSRNSGEAYLTVKGKLKAKKDFKSIPCGCKKECDKKIPENERRIIFEEFWKLADFNKQNIFIRSSVMAHGVSRKRITNGKGNEKTVSFSYTLRYGKRTELVCKKYFLDTFQVSHGRVYRCLSKPDVDAILDHRGKKIPSNKIDDADIVAHIRSFQDFPSHYSSEKNSDRQYLHQDLNIRKMYDLYCEECKSEGKEPLKKKFYYHVFSTKFNLHFKPPSKDTYINCDNSELKIKAESNPYERKKLKIEKSLHLANAEQARKAMKTDGEGV